ncbi:MAG TPA: hypothetical protein VIT91_00945 [Chthoniobacterales bacterium]
MKIFLTTFAAAVLAFTGISHAADDKTAAKPYALETCLISGEKLGEMGKPVVFDYQGQQIKLCCKDCKKQFDKDPAKAMAEYEAAVKKGGTVAKSHEHTH